MALPASLQLARDFGHCRNRGCCNQHMIMRILYRIKLHLSSAAPFYHVSDFTMNVVRNLSQKTHWRFKTHLAISHMDVNKINSIVADIRKVLAKNPQVEQQKLHRRVFLDNIVSENQALLVSMKYWCPVLSRPHTTNNFCAKEALLLDRLRFIGHHRARLATPVRTPQKIYSDADLENKPYMDSVYSGTGTVSNSPIIIEPPYNIKSDDTTKSRLPSPSNEGDKNTATQTKVRETRSDSKADVEAVISNSDANGNLKVTVTSKLNPEVDEHEPMKMESNSVLVWQRLACSHKHVQQCFSVKRDNLLHIFVSACVNKSISILKEKCVCF